MTEKPNSDVIQTLRTAHQNQTQLNLMADQKANILIGTLVLMFTVVLTRLITLASDDHSKLLTLAVFVVMQLVPLVLTVLVLIPKNINSTKQEKIQDISNPLFFGFFTQYPQQQYSDFMENSLVDNESARRMLTDDIYQIGVILKRKYRLLRMAYLFALLGVVVPVIMWLLTAFN